MPEKEENSINLKDWFQKSVTFEIDDLESFIKIFKKIIKEHGFKVLEEKNREKSGSINAIYGSKIRAILTQIFLPFGKHLPFGKRFGMKVFIEKGSSIKLDITISPYMELFNTSEVLVLSQSVGEKVTDEYLAAQKMLSIIRKLFQNLKIEIPKEFEKFEYKRFTRGSFLNFLIFPLEGYKSQKKIHLPKEEGPKWCWPAFILPEFWFIWHEIWGASFLIFILYFFAIYFLIYFGLPLIYSGIIILAVRILIARYGDTIYYYKHGKWRK